MTRKTIKSELDYASSAAAVLQKQHDRLVTIVEALLQAGSWMRSEDLTENERHILRQAREFVKEMQIKCS